MMMIKFLSDVERSSAIGGVNVAIFPSIVECHGHRIKVGYANFR